MDLFFDTRADTRAERGLNKILCNIPEDVTCIRAAIAYNNTGLLLEKCEERNIGLEWWGLFDERGATSYELIKKAIKQPKVKFYLCAKYFHPKVIYFENHGLYIGSANMTQSALDKNIEAGIFLYEEELDEDKKEELSSFFIYLENNSKLADDSDIEKIDKFLSDISLQKEEIESKENKIKTCFRKHFSDIQEELSSNTNISSNPFIDEWEKTHEYLEQIKNRMVKIYDSSSWPNWISEQAKNVPSIIVDQLLNTYFQHLCHHNGQEVPSDIDKYYELHKNDKDTAFKEAIEWSRDQITLPVIYLKLLINGVVKLKIFLESFEALTSSAEKILKKL